MDAAQVVEVLALARAFVEAGWCQGGLATDHAGIPCGAWEPTAADFCALGALHRARLELGLSRYDPPVAMAEQLLDEASGCDDMALLNDAPTTTKRQVLALFDQAAARVGGK